MMQQHSQGPLSSSQGPIKDQSDPSLQATDPSSSWACDPEPCCCCCGLPDSFEGPCDFSRSLPVEMSEQIFLRLDPSSLCSAAQTCRRWHRLIHSSEAVWRGQCLLLRAHCSREVDRDRGHGFSWKVTLVRNYARSCLKRDWLKGRFSCVRSANELRDVNMVPFDAESWGEILQAELER